MTVWSIGSVACRSFRKRSKYRPPQELIDAFFADWRQGQSRRIYAYPCTTILTSANQRWEIPKVDTKLLHVLGTIMNKNAMVGLDLMGCWYTPLILTTCRSPCLALYQMACTQLQFAPKQQRTDSEENDWVKQTNKSVSALVRSESQSIGRDIY